MIDNNNILPNKADIIKHLESRLTGINIFQDNQYIDKISVNYIYNLTNNFC